VLSAITPFAQNLLAAPWIAVVARWGGVGSSEVIWKIPDSILTAMASCCRVDVKHAEAEPWFGFPSSYGNAEVMMMVPVLRVKAFWPNFATSQAT
jgi:hypothetical protein